MSSSLIQRKLAALCLATGLSFAIGCDIAYIEPMSAAGEHAGHDHNHGDHDHAGHDHAGHDHDPGDHHSDHAGHSH